MSLRKKDEATKRLKWCRDLEKNSDNESKLVTMNQNWLCQNVGNKTALEKDMTLVLDDITFGIGRNGRIWSYFDTRPYFDTLVDNVQII